MYLGAESVFVGSGIFKSSSPEKLAHAIVQATTHYQNPKIVAECSKGLGAPMRGLDIHQLKAEERLSERGW
jgi:pyridoxal 5'-phosphate synthase pdxS subunit